jgi:putative PIN family toxin of toxin-antitoxin system
LRFVFDTNVIVSALLLTDSVSRRALDRALDRGRILLSFAVLKEINEVLGRKRFRKYVHEEDVRQFIAALAREAEWIEVATRITACRDARDDKFLELAVSGRAQYIVSGDSDLLVLSPFRGITVLTPQAFLESPLPLET